MYPRAGDRAGHVCEVPIRCLPLLAKVTGARFHAMESVTTTAPKLLCPYVSNKVSVLTGKPDREDGGPWTME
jgi:hypothetical protein